MSVCLRNTSMLLWFCYVYCLICSCTIVGLKKIQRKSLTQISSRDLSSRHALCWITICPRIPCLSFQGMYLWTWTINLRVWLRSISGCIHSLLAIVQIRRNLRQINKIMVVLILTTTHGQVLVEFIY